MSELTSLIKEEDCCARVRESGNIAQHLKYDFTVGKIRPCESRNCRIVSRPTGGWHKVFLISSRVILSLPTSQLMNFGDMHVLKSRTQNARKFLVSVNL